MAIARACELTVVQTGEVLIFDTISLAEQFLDRTNGYIWKHVEADMPILDRHGTEYTANILPRRQIQCNTRSYEQQICWKCRKSSGGCTWSRCFKPVDGWEAKYIPSRPQVPATYSITACPEFVVG